MIIYNQNAIKSWNRNLKSRITTRTKLADLELSKIPNYMKGDLKNLGKANRG